MEAATDQPRPLALPAGRNLRDRSEARTRAIIADIQGGLAKGTLKPGDRLPDERSLCTHYGAGRYTVRKALDLLVTQGRVTRHVGRGSFITVAPESPKPHKEPRRDRSWSLLELTEARLLLEPGIGPLVLERATAEDFGRLEACIRSIRKAGSWREFKESKYAFHRALAEATRNGFVTHIFDLIIAARRKEWADYHCRVHDMIEARAACVDESSAILKALLAGDPDGATETIRRSIARIMVTVCAQ